MKYQEIKQDLFQMDVSYSLAHSISLQRKCTGRNQQNRPLS